MKDIISKVKFPLFLLILTLGFSQCIDDNFDEPPTGGTNPDVINDTNTVSVEDVLDLYSQGSVTALAMDMYMEGSVIGNDVSGNIFKTLFVQNGDYAIGIVIDETNLFNIYFEGRKVFVHLQNLAVGDFNGLPQLGMYSEENGIGSVERIPAGLVSEIVLPGVAEAPLTPKVTRINQLGQMALNSLVQLDEVQFASFDRGETFADAITQFSLNRTLEDCDGNEVIVRSSGFADFAAETTPTGNGSLIAIYTIFGETKQLVLRSLEDSDGLSGTLCDGSSGGGGGGEVMNVDIPAEDILNISDVLSQWNPGSVVNLDGSKYITGFVTANDESGNFFKQIVFQDETGGMNIQLDGLDLFESYPVGRRVYVNLNGLAISDFNGLPQIGLPDGDQVSRVEENSIPTTVLADDDLLTIEPEVISINDLQQGDLNKLIRFEDVEFVSSDQNQTYADADNQFALNRAFKDCDNNSMDLRTSGFSNFASITTPDRNGNLTAIYTIFQGSKQAVIRNLSDVSMSNPLCDGGGTGTGGDGCGGQDDPLANGVDEDFEGFNDFDPVNLEGWVNCTDTGTDQWYTRSFDDNGFAEVEGFQADNPDVDAWLLTPPFDLASYNTLEFQTAQAFWQHDGLTVMISTDYDGDVTTSTWTMLDANLPTGNEENFTWVNSGEVDLSAFSGTARVGFRYVGNSASNTTKIRIDNLTIQ